MGICDRLYDIMAEKAADHTVEVLSIGLGYTAACTSNGGIGLAYTPVGDKKRCSFTTWRHAIPPVPPPCTSHTIFISMGNLFSGAMPPFIYNGLRQTPWGDPVSIPLPKRTGLAACTDCVRYLHPFDG